MLVKAESPANMSLRRILNDYSHDHTSKHVYETRVSDIHWTTTLVVFSVKQCD